MEPQCAVCGSTHLTEHSLGFFVCALCGTQAATQITQMDDPPLPTPKKRTTRDVMKKTRKEKQATVQLTLTEYLALYKQYLDLCVRDMVRECGVTSAAFDLAGQIWTKLTAHYGENTAIVKPKNSRFHIDRKAKLALPIEMKQELAEIMQNYGQNNRRSVPYTLTELQQECVLRGLVPPTAKDIVTRRLQTALVLVAHSRVGRRGGNTQVSTEELLREFDQVEHRVEKLPLSTILPVLYLAAYYAGDSKAVLLVDVLDWVRNLKIRYITGYKTLPLPAKYVSLFRPTTLPGEEWLRREVTTLQTQLRLTPDPSLTLMLERLNRDLALPETILSLGGKVLKYFEKELSEYVVQRPLELRAVAGVFIAFKLLYGLNGIPYSALCPATRQTTSQHPTAQADALVRLTCSLPSLNQLITQWKARFDSRTTFPWSPSDLQSLSPDHDLTYITKLQQSGLLQETQVKEVKSLFLALGPQQEQEKAQIKEEWTAVEYREHWQVNADLTQELEHLKDPQAEVPLPCMDWQTFKKKTEHRYPQEYVLVLCAFAELGGRQKLSELHELVDRLERLVAKQGSAS